MAERVQEGSRYNKRLTEKEKMAIIADYLQCGNYSEVARHYNTNYKNIAYVVTHNIELQAELSKHHEENKQDIINYMNSKKQAACDIIELYLNLLQDKAKTEKASVKDLAITLGIVIDKFTKDGASTASETEGHNSIISAITGITDKMPDDSDEENDDIGGNEDASQSEP